MTQVRVKNRLNEVAAAVREAAIGLVNEAAAAHVELARALAPVDTGALRDSIMQTKTATVDSPSVRIEVRVDYAGYVEYGHHTASGSFVPAQPFFNPALEAARERFKSVRVRLR